MRKLGKILMTPWFFRRLALVWACGLCTVIVLKTFGALPLIDGPRATLLGTFFGVLVTIVGFYHKDRSSDQGKSEVEPVIEPEVISPVPIADEEPLAP